ncbi:MAG: 4Fe-4S binding protein, partial [Lachnospiraceae bacterium]|nr:4Fe-4S binding protein [Lachnospiraceae bacterium]
VIIARPFCKYLCPLGAIYAPLNKVSLYRMQCDHAKCISCGKCSAVCEMCVDPVKDANSTECIRCLKCVHECPVKALHAGIGTPEKKSAGAFGESRKEKKSE